MGPARSRPCAPAIHDEFAADWAAVDKNERGRVGRAAFVKHLLAKHAGRLTAGSTPAFTEFLGRAFDAGTALMLPAKKPDLGRHCFSYAALLAGEFYFAAAQEAATPGCGCDTPVADILELTK